MSKYLCYKWKCQFYVCELVTTWLCACVTTSINLVENDKPPSLSKNTIDCTYR